MEKPHLIITQTSTLFKGLKALSEISFWTDHILDASPWSDETFGIIALVTEETLKHPNFETIINHFKITVIKNTPTIFLEEVFHLKTVESKEELVVIESDNFGKLLENIYEGWSKYKAQVVQLHKTFPKNRASALLTINSDNLKIWLERSNQSENKVTAIPNTENLRHFLF